jgi:hypothetical protein
MDLILFAVCFRNAYINVHEANLPFAWVQDDDQSMSFDHYIPRPLCAVVVGTLPVSFIAIRLFPAWLASHPFDLRWAGFHLLLGVVFWYVAGRFSETSKSWRIAIVAYLAFRCTTLPLSLSRGSIAGTLEAAYVVLWFVAGPGCVGYRCGGGSQVAYWGFLGGAVTITRCVMSASGNTNCRGVSGNYPGPTRSCKA